MTRQGATNQQLLRLALFGNAAFSILSALVMLFWQDGIKRWLGAPADFNVLFVAVGLIVFAIWLLLNALRSQIKLSDARIAVGMDLAWVVVSVPVLLFGPLRERGQWIVGVVAVIVLCFAVAQAIGIRRVRGSD